MWHQLRSLSGSLLVGELDRPSAGPGWSPVCLAPSRGDHCPEHLHMAFPIWQLWPRQASYVVAQGSQRKCSKRQEVEAASFLRPGSRNRRGITSAVKAVTKPAPIQGEQISAPLSDGRRVKEIVAVFKMLQWVILELTSLLPTVISLNFLKTKRDDLVKHQSDPNFLASNSSVNWSQPTFPASFPLDLYLLSFPRGISLRRVVWNSE